MTKKINGVAKNIIRITDQRHRQIECPDSLGIEERFRSSNEMLFAKYFAGNSISKCFFVANEFMCKYVPGKAGVSMRSSAYMRDLAGKQAKEVVATLVQLVTDANRPTAVRVSA